MRRTACAGRPARLGALPAGPGSRTVNGVTLKGVQTAGRNTNMVRKAPAGLSIPVAGVRLDADLVFPARPLGLVLFAHGSGSSRHSPRNRAVAEALRGRGYGAVLADLLTADEERDEQARFDIDLLARRLGGLIDWLVQYPETAELPI